jgi:hypothetical protein
MGADESDMFHKTVTATYTNTGTVTKVLQCRYFGLIRVQVWANLTFISTAWFKW